MIVDPPHPTIELADHHDVADHRRMVLGHRLSQTRLAMRKIVEFAVMRTLQAPAHCSATTLLNPLR